MKGNKGKREGLRCCTCNHHAADVGVNGSRFNTHNNNNNETNKQTKDPPPFLALHAKAEKENQPNEEKIATGCTGVEFQTVGPINE